jgi:hypothetical protein
MILKILIVFVFSLILSSCSDEEGIGGETTLRGYVWQKDYNAEFTKLKFEGPAQKEDVFIIYGSDTTSFDDDTKTHWDGSFEFRYLKEGTYTVYVYSKDSSGIADNIEKPDMVVKRTITIGSSEDIVELPDTLVILN